MNANTRIRVCVTAGITALALAQFTLPSMAGGNEYACKVKTIGGQSGIVLVQADSKVLAAKAAKGATAFTYDNGRATATSVERCIDRRNEQFTDYQFQQFFESIPL